MPDLPPASPASQKLYGLDHLRALAIVLVFFFHYFILSHGQPEWLPDLASFGWVGVDLFFVLSGYLISSRLFSQISQGEVISFPLFFMKRAFRILPAFWCTLALYFCIPFFREKEALPPLWKFLTFTQNIGLDLQHHGTFSHAWSLCVEEHFYLCLPLILILLRKWRIFGSAYWLIMVLIAAGLALRIYSFGHFYIPQKDTDNSWVYWYQYVYYPTWNRLDGLLAGISLAGLVHFYPLAWRLLCKRGNVLLCLSILLLTAAWFLCRDPQAYTASVCGFPLIALGFGCMVAGAVSPQSILYRWRSRVTSHLAGLSYAIYLTHKGIIHITQAFLAGFQLDSNIVLLICIATCLAGAWFLHAAIEKPFMRLRDHLLKKKAAPQRVSADIPFST